MIRPRATYRLQFRNGMSFESAAALVPYLAELGVSHVYASPIFAAAPGSTHGYDVVDVTRLSSDLGGAEGFETLATELKRHGLGLILDFVPNHMGASTHNPWWLHVLEWGAASPYAEHFDIDWSAPKLIVPALGANYGEELAKGAFGLHFDRADGGITFTYYDLKLPLTLPSYAQLLSRMERDDFAEFARRFIVAAPEESGALKQDIADAAAADPSILAAIEQALADTASDLEAIHALHEAQIWRLAHWRAARETLTYRRFFEIADLVGLKVERPKVFDDVHARLLELAREGTIDGVRLDHIDGLADPRGYLDKLQAAIGGDEPFYLVVEKILGPDEELRPEWPVAGTTGYEFIRSLANLLTDPAGEEAATQGYHRFLGHEVDYDALALENKRRLLARNLTGELDVLKDMARALAEKDPMTRDYGADTLRRAVLELIAALPVYRTYVDVTGASDTDRDLISAAVDAAKTTREVEDEGTLDFLARVLVLDFADPEDQATALEFATRFQQTTGPVMAKAIEDTLFYRYNRLIGLNEVGGEPDRFGAPPEQFHYEMMRRLARQPFGLSATSTHDTKRGEDARARLYALSEMPEDWSAAVERWSAQNAALRADLSGLPVPEPETEWAFYQALLGAWPPALSPADGDGLGALAERMAQFMLKAVREAKVYTSWTAQDADYERAVEQFTRRTLDAEVSPAFLDDFLGTCRPVFIAGALNGLTQTLLKLTAPGVPDIYQGAEGWDFSLVDPDNRRPVDFDARRQMLERIADADVAALVGNWISGAPKMHVMRAGLSLRARSPALFADGAYLPLGAEGARAEHVIAFARTHGADAVITVAPRFALGLLEGETAPLIPGGRWEDTRILLPEEMADRSWRNLLDGAHQERASALPLRELLPQFPVALLEAE